MPISIFSPAVSPNSFLASANSAWWSESGPKRICRRSEHGCQEIAGCLLGTHVARRADDHAGLRQRQRLSIRISASVRRLVNRRDAEITHQRASGLLVPQNVRGTAPPSTVLPHTA